MNIFVSQLQIIPLKEGFLIMWFHSIKLFQPILYHGSTMQSFFSILRQNETAEQRKIRLEDQAKRQSTSRANETAEQRTTRLEDQAERQSTSRALETAEQRTNRLED